MPFIFSQTQENTLWQWVILQRLCPAFCPGYRQPLDFTSEKFLLNYLPSCQKEYCMNLVLSLLFQAHLLRHILWMALTTKITISKWYNISPLIFRHNFTRAVPSYIWLWKFQQLEQINDSKPNQTLRHTEDSNSRSRFIWADKLFVVEKSNVGGSVAWLALDSFASSPDLDCWHFPTIFFFSRPDSGFLRDKLRPFPWRSGSKYAGRAIRPDYSLLKSLNSRKQVFAYF